MVQKISTRCRNYDWGDNFSSPRFPQVAFNVSDVDIYCFRLVEVKIDFKQNKRFFYFFMWGLLLMDLMCTFGKYIFNAFLLNFFPIHRRIFQQMPKMYLEFVFQLKATKTTQTNNIRWMLNYWISLDYSLIIMSKLRKINITYLCFGSGNHFGISCVGRKLALAKFSKPVGRMCTCVLAAVPTFWSCATIVCWPCSQG